MLDAIRAVIETLDADPPDVRAAIGEARKKFDEVPLLANPNSALALPSRDAEGLNQLGSLIRQFMMIVEENFDVLQKQIVALQEENKSERVLREAAERRAARLFAWGIALGLPVGILAAL